jgi:hypothetical protein
MSEAIIVISTDRRLTEDDLDVINDAVDKRVSRAIFTASRYGMALDVWADR